MIFSRLRHHLLFGSGLVTLLYLCLVAIAMPSREGPQIVLPQEASLLVLVGAVLLVLAQLTASVDRTGWRRLLPLLTLVPMSLGLLMGLGLTETQLVRHEVDRLTLPDGRLVMLTLEPGTTDTIFAVWLEEGWRWRPLFEGVTQVSYSEDGSFTENPALVVSRDGQHLLIRRGGLWTDCWRIGVASSPCLPDALPTPVRRSEWFDRSDRIAALVGMDPARR